MINWWLIDDAFKQNKTDLFQRLDWFYTDLCDLWVLSALCFWWLQTDNRPLNYIETKHLIENVSQCLVLWSRPYSSPFYCSTEVFPNLHMNLIPFSIPICLNYSRKYLLFMRKSYFADTFTSSLNWSCKTSMSLTMSHLTALLNASTSSGQALPYSFMCCLQEDQQDTRTQTHQSSEPGLTHLKH